MQFIISRFNKNTPSSYYTVIHLLTCINRSALSYYFTMLLKLMIITKTLYTVCLVHCVYILHDNLITDASEPFFLNNFKGENDPEVNIK